MKRVRLVYRGRPEAYNYVLLSAPQVPFMRIIEEALTFDDVLLLPGYSEVVATQVSLQTRLTRGIELNIPLVSAAMYTVTEYRLAIAMAQEGGIGIIHKSMTIAEQAEQGDPRDLVPRAVDHDQHGDEQRDPAQPPAGSRWCCMPWYR